MHEAVDFWYRSVPDICAPHSRISPSYIFSQSSCTGIFISRIGPPTMAILSIRRNSYTVKFKVPTRTKPVSIEQLRNLLLIASMFASGVNQLVDAKSLPRYPKGQSTVSALNLHSNSASKLNIPKR